MRNSIPREKKEVAAAASNATYYPLTALWDPSAPIGGGGAAAADRTFESTKSLQF